MAEGGYDDFDPLIQNREEEEYDRDDAYEESIHMHDLSQQTVYAEVESCVGDLNTQ